MDRATLTSADPAHSNHPSDSLTVAALAYLALPNVVFFWGWLTTPVALALTVGTISGFIHLVRDTSPSPIPSRILCTLAAIAALWCVFGGAGHFTHANIDWKIRDAVYGDLIYSTWPPAYRIEGDVAWMLRSAIGYFLIPALITAKIGIAYADIILYGWTVVGTAIFLSLCPIRWASPLKGIALCLLIILFSGMDIAGCYVATGEWPIFPLRIEWWGPFSYPSLSGQLFWAPNHTLPLWICSALFFRHWGNRSFLKLAIYLAPLTLIWTPFAAIAFIPFIALYLFTTSSSAPPECPKTILIMPGILVSVVLVGFLTPNLDGIPAAVARSPSSVTAKNYAADYVAFIVFEFAVIAMFIWRSLQHSKGVALTSITILLLLPFLHFGPSNDLMLRVSSPALVMLAFLATIIVADNLNGRSDKSSWAVLITIAIGSATPIFEMSRAVLMPYWKPDYLITLIDTQKGGLPAHYIGQINWRNFSWILKAPHTVPDDKARRTRPDL